MIRAAEPAAIARLPRFRGYPVPFFATWNSGTPDFRIITEAKVREAIEGDLCWVCGGPLQGLKAFTLGPICAVNRVTADPPAHIACATYSALTCPFLSNPQAARRMDGLPAHGFAGAGIARNPGVAVVWVTPDFQAFNVGNGILCKPGDPVEVVCYVRGAEATPEQVRGSMETDMPCLLNAAAEAGPEYVEDFKRRAVEALRTLGAL